MRVVHSFDHKGVEKEVQGNPGFLLTNNHGGFFSQGAKANFTKYNGLVLFENEHYKFIESINLPSLGVDKIKNNFNNVQRISGSAIETFIFDMSNVFIYKINGYLGKVELALDCRKLYDFSDMGRIYNITHESGCIVIEYSKYRTGNLREVDYCQYLAIKGADYKAVKAWEPRDYCYDLQREINHSEHFVFHALDFRIDGDTEIVFSGSTDKEKAINDALKAYERIAHIESSLKTHITTSIYPEFHMKSKKDEVAYICAKNSLRSLVNNLNGQLGLYAGLPWFHQFWARDEAISSGAFIREGDFKTAKNILFRHLKNINVGGRIENRWPFSDLESADAVGWVFARLFELLKELEKEGKIYNYLDETDIIYIKKKLGYCIQNLLKYHTSEGLSYNDALETWMDTSYRGDRREGFRIEIQTLRLNMYKFMQYLCELTQNRDKLKRYVELEEVTRKKVKEMFFNGYLYDGKDDATIRPNIFLAAYIYPSLLKRREWQKCFDKVLPSLWLEWGGLSTIDKEDSLFSPVYTGENNVSYHRGDSWFFINNFAAICLLKVNKRRYKKYINSIFRASRKDIFSKGIVGHCSELSSAREQKAQGSLVQAWSASSFIELIYSL
ncbi:MAG: amylo-alpha-1,6-glucosidase [Nanobdellota archaeon]